MTEETFTSRDIVIAEKMGGLTTAILSLESKVDSLMRDKNAVHDTLWKKIDEHAEKISDHNGLIKWIIGVGTGIQIVWGSILFWFSKHS